MVCMHALCMCHCVCASLVEIPSLQIPLGIIPRLGAPLANKSPKTRRGNMEIACMVNLAAQRYLS